MNKLQIGKLVSGLCLTTLMYSCYDAPVYEDPRVEQYTQTFAKEFGLINSEQDWNMSRSVDLSVNVGKEASSVKIYAKHGVKYYLVANLQDVEGRIDVPVHVPKTTQEYMVKVDGQMFFGTSASTIDCSKAQSRGVPDFDYDDWTYDENNPNAPVFSKKDATTGNYGVSVQHTTSGNRDDDGKCYQYFNTQQMSPIVATKVWESYWSLNTNGAIDANGNVGILPESGIFNRKKEDLLNWIADKDIAIDFTVKAGSNGKFTVYPYYYGTNLVHTLGVYLIDEDGEPRRNSSGDIIKLPIFHDKQPGDMQINPRIHPVNELLVYEKNSSEELKELNIQVGETKDLKIVLKNNGTEFDYDDDYKAQYYNILSFHVWDNEDGLVTIDDKGSITINDIDKIEQRVLHIGITTDLNDMYLSGIGKNITLKISRPGAASQTYDLPTTGNVSTSYVASIQGSIPWSEIVADWGEHAEEIYIATSSGDGFEKEDDGNTPKFVQAKLDEFFNDIKAAFERETAPITISSNGSDYTSANYNLVGLKLNERNPWYFNAEFYFEAKVESAPWRHVISRAVTSKPSILDFDSSIGWKDVNSCWSRYMPMGEEVASYSPNRTMLARTRGYDVTLTNPDGSPYTGEFGMYIDVDQEINMVHQGGYGYSDSDNGGYYEYVKSELTNKYTVYSQQKHNYLNQIGAASFRHPMTGRVFFSFEDMQLTHLGPGLEGGYEYGDDEESSDRDVNDLIFLVKGFESIEGGGKKITETVIEEEGFSWIWALEDLGSTGDFDFNDVVIRIKDITTTTKTTETIDGESKVTSTIARTVSFMPLAAGGILPIYVHFTYKGTDYVLEPGTFDLVKGTNVPSGLEYHRWFGKSINGTPIMNTGNGRNVRTNESNACVLIVDKDGFSLNLCESGSQQVTKGNIFYITVNTDEDYESIQNIDKDRLGDSYLIPLPKKGKAAQSFIICEPENGETWQWPTECTHILSAYPRFGDWVSDPSVEWTANPIKGATFKFE